MIDSDRIRGPLAPCPCTDKSACPECNGTLSLAERIKRRHDRMTGEESLELWRRLTDFCNSIDEDEEVHDLGEAEVR